MPLEPKMRSSRILDLKRYHTTHKGYFGNFGLPTIVEDIYIVWNDGCCGRNAKHLAMIETVTHNEEWFCVKQTFE